MNWFMNNKMREIIFPKSTKKSENSPIKLAKSFESLKQLCHDQAQEILKLEKESVYWKEKALKFKRFHQ